MEDGKEKKMVQLLQDDMKGSVSSAEDRGSQAEGMAVKKTDSMHERRGEKKQNKKKRTRSFI